MEFIELAKQCSPSVAPETMAAVVKTESGFKPFAIGVNGATRLARQPRTKVEAATTAKWLIANGYNVDLGLGQINSNNLARTSLTIEDAFDSCKNLSAAAMILTQTYLVAVPRVGSGQKALHVAFSTYNTGSPSKGFANGYVQRVLANGNAVAPSMAPLSSAVPIDFVATGASTPVISEISQTNSGPVRLSASFSQSTLVRRLTSSDPHVKSVLRNSSVSVYEYTADTVNVYP